MKQLLTLAFCLLSIYGHSQCASWGTIAGTLSTQTDLYNALANKVNIPQKIDRDTATYTSDFWGGLIPNRDTAADTNRWYVINDPQHESSGIDSIIATNTVLKVYCKNRNYDMIGVSLAVTDESMSAGIAQREKSTDCVFRPHLYNMGCRIYLDHAEISISKPDNLRFYCRWTGTYWQISTFNGNQVTSPAIDLTYSNGRVRINTAEWYEINGTAQATPWASNGDSSLFFIPIIEQSSRTFLDIYFLDPFNGGGSPRKLAATTPPTGLAFVLDFGQYWVSVNPRTERFATGSNIIFTGIGFKDWK